MALTPEIDALVAQIVGLDSLVAALDGVQPIHITIGSYNLVVDPVANADAYRSGAAVLRSVAQSAQNDLRNAIAATAMAQSGP